MKKLRFESANVIGWLVTEQRQCPAFHCGELTNALLCFLGHTFMLFICSEITVGNSLGKKLIHSVKILGLQVPRLPPKKL